MVTALNTVIPKREERERVIDYARRLKKSGFIPREIMDESLYGIAKHQEGEEHKAFIDGLKKEHKCLTCEGRGVVKDSKGDWINCLSCQGSGLESVAFIEELAPKELELLELLRGEDVHELKLNPDIIHNAFWYFEYAKTKDEDKLRKFFGRVHVVKRGKEYLVVSGFQKAWKYIEAIELKKQGKEVAISEEVPF